MPEWNVAAGMVPHLSRRSLQAPSGAARRNAKGWPEAMVRPERAPPSWGQGGGKIKRRDRKPVSVFESAIYLRNLPPDIGRAALICQYIWFCRPWCRTRNTSLQCAVGSYPTFSPSLPGQARRQTFSVTAGKRLLPSAISAAGRPFLSGLSSPDL